MKKKFRCPFCDRNYIGKEGKGALYQHMEAEHSEQLNNLSAAQVYFNWRNRYALNKGNGKSVISGRPTKFNEITERYERFLPEEKEKYRELFISRMKKVYGKETLLNDLDHQKKMLANRSISGRYKWNDGTEFIYTGSYEKKFLEYLDKELSWNSSDIMAPAPQTFVWKDEKGRERLHFPDFYISSINTIIEIKSSENKHYRLRDLEKEKAKDNAVKKSNFNYIKIYDNKFDKFLDVLEILKNNNNKPENQRQKIIIESHFNFKN